MSPIGRVFIIVNLILAGAFIGFAGTFLQNHTNWKTQFDSEKLAHDSDVAAAALADNSLRSELATSVSQATQTHQLLESSRSDLADANTENQRLSAQLDTMEGNINLISANTQGMRSSIDAAVQNAQQASQDSIAAQAERDQAVQAREEAVANLRDANFNMTQLQDQLQAQAGQIAGLQGDIREKDILIEVAKVNGFLLEMAQPDLRGVVTVVGASGRLLTVSITENPGDAAIEPGIQFAIYSGDTYKGDARVTSVEGTYAFCTLVAAPEATIVVGDRAATKLN